MKQQNKLQLQVEAKFFKGLADKSRLEILECTLNGKKTVTEIIEMTQLTQSNVSNHLSCLLECGLVVRNRHGLHSYYAASSPEVERLIDVMKSIVSQRSRELFECTRY
jgi:ArsR family transcriptional regulator